jgi:hypothetical protein
LKACEWLTDQREAEYRFLASDEFLTSLSLRGIILTRQP